jgi:hypothetical protein
VSTANTAPGTIGVGFDADHDEGDRHRTERAYLCRVSFYSKKPITFFHGDSYQNMQILLNNYKTRFDFPELPESRDKKNA